MAIEIFKLVGSIMVDNDKAKKSISDTGKSAQDTGNKFVSLGEVAKKAAGVIGAVFTAKAVLDFGKTCINAAEALEQTMKKTEIIFGDSAEAVTEWALNNERVLGLGSGTIQGYMNGIADITQGMGMAKDASIDFAKGATELGVKLANWNGIDAGAAIDDIKRAMTGSHDAVDKYGIKLNDAVLKQTAMNMGLGDNFQKLTESEKAQVRYQAILDSSANAIDYWNEGNRSMSFYIKEAKEQFGNITETIGGLFLPMAKEAAEKFADIAAKANEFVTKVVEAIKSFKEGMENGEDAVDNLWFVCQDVFGIQLPDSFLSMVSSIIRFFRVLWDTVKEIWDTAAVPIIEIYKEAFNGLAENSDAIFTFIGDCFNAMIDVIRTVWETLGQPVLDLIMQAIGWVRDAFAERMPQITEFFSGFVNDIVKFWNTNLKPCLDAIGNFISTVLAPIFEFVFKSKILPIVDACFKGIKDLWNNSLKPILTGITDFLTGIFTLNFSQAFSGILSVVDGIWSGLVAVVKTPINAVIGMINSFIRGLNTLKIPDWVPGIGGKGINIGEIPMLAKGTDYFKGGMAIVGEQGPELVELPRGARVNTATETKEKLSGGNTYNFFSKERLSEREIMRQQRNLERQLAIGLI